MSDTGTLLHPEAWVAARISNMVVGVVHTHTGRGPTRAWTWIEDDVISVVLRDLLSQGELSLIASGRNELVMGVRRAHQQTMKAELTAGVEDLTGRSVIAFLSADHLDPDIAVESFILEPAVSAHVAQPRKR
jgi:uncharacterized protein YbcI